MSTAHDHDNGSLAKTRPAVGDSEHAAAVRDDDGKTVAGRGDGQTPAARTPADAGHRQVGIDGVSGFMGMHWDGPETVRLQIRPELINAAGLLSGVVTYALVDYCMGSTLWPHTTEDEHIATLNISINYIQTATEGEIVCTSVLDRRNRTNAVLRSEVRDRDGHLLVTAIGSYAIFPARRPAGAARTSA